MNVSYNITAIENASGFGSYLYQIDASTSFMLIPILTIAICIAVFASVSKTERKANLFIPIIAGILFASGAMLTEEGFNPSAMPTIALLLLALFLSIGINISEKFG